MAFEDIRACRKKAVARCDCTVNIGDLEDFGRLRAQVAGILIHDPRNGGRPGMVRDGLGPLVEIGDVSSQRFDQRVVQLSTLGSLAQQRVVGETAHLQQPVGGLAIASKVEMAIGRSRDRQYP